MAPKLPSVYWYMCSLYILEILEELRICTYGVNLTWYLISIYSPHMLVHIHTYVHMYIKMCGLYTYVYVYAQPTYVHMYMHCYACIHTCMCMHRHTHSQIHIPHRHNALKIMYTSFNTILHHFQLSIYISNDFMLQSVLKIVHTYIHTCIHICSTYNMQGCTSVGLLDS